MTNRKCFILRVKEAAQPPAEGEQVAAVNETVNVVQDEEPDMWEETFKTHTDSKPNGPESVGMDIAFHDFEHVFGIPQHADQFSLRSTT